MPVTQEQIQTAIDRKLAQQPQQNVTDEQIQTAIMRKLGTEPELGTNFISPTIPLKAGEQIPLGRQSTEGLISSLGTKLPAPGPPKQISDPQPFSDIGLEATAARSARADETRRQRNLLTIQELSFRRFSLKDIEERLNPTFVQQLKQDIGRTAGGIGGGIAGAKAGALAGSAVAPGIGTLIGGLAGAAIGAGIGGFVGEDVQNTVEMVQIANKAQRGEELTFRDRNLIERTENDVKSERRNAAFGEAFFELVGRVGIGTLGKVFRRPFASAVLPEVAAFSDDLARVGGQFSPAQLIEGSAAKSKLTAFFADFIDTLESIGEKGFGGRGIFKRFRALEQQIPYEKLIQGTADDILGTAVRMTPEQKAVMLLDVIKNRKTVYKGVRNSLYRWATKANAGNNILVTIEPLEKFLNNETRRLSGKLGGGELGESLIKKLNDIVAQVRTRGRVRNTRTGQFVSGKQMTIIEVEDMLQGLNSEIRKLGRTGDTPGKRLATVAKSIMTREARKAEKGLSPEVFRRLGVAKKFVREGQPIFEEQFVRTLIDVEKGLGKNPEILNKILFPRGKPSQVARSKELILGKGKFARGLNQRKWNNLTVGWLEDAIAGSANSADGIFSVTKFQSKLNQLGPKSLDTMFGSSAAKKISSIPKIGAILTGETGGGGNLAIRIAQITAIGGIASGNDKIQAVSAGILIAPSLLALLFTSNVGIKALTTGLRAKPGSREASAAVIRMLGIARRLQKEKGIADKKRSQPVTKTQGISKLALAIQ